MKIKMKLFAAMMLLFVFFVTNVNAENFKPAYNKAVQLQDETKQKFDAASTNFQLGKKYYQEGDYKSAELSLNNAVADFEQSIAINLKCREAETEAMYDAGDDIPPGICQDPKSIKATKANAHLYISAVLFSKGQFTNDEINAHIEKANTLGVKEASAEMDFSPKLVALVQNPTQTLSTEIQDGEKIIGEPPVIIDDNWGWGKTLGVVLGVAAIAALAGGGGGDGDSEPPPSNEPGTETVIVSW